MDLEIAKTAWKKSTQGQETGQAPGSPKRTAWQGNRNREKALQTGPELPLAART